MGFCVQTTSRGNQSFCIRLNWLSAQLSDIKNIKYPDLGQVELWTSLKFKNKHTPALFSKELKLRVKICI